MRIDISIHVWYTPPPNMTTYIIGCLALIIKPGPDLMCTIATALSEGRARAFTLMSGLIAGCWLWIILLTLGVASFLTEHPAAMLAIQSVGIAYIAYLAAMTFREAFGEWRGGSASDAKAEHRAGWALFRRGIAMSMSNPLTILFFLAFLPGFARSGSSIPPALQTLALGTLFCLLVPFVYGPIILLADSFRARLSGNKHFSAGLKAVSALILAAVVAILAAGMI